MKTTTTRLRFALMFVLALSLAACGSAEESSDTNNEPVIEEDERLAFTGTWVQETQAGKEEYRFLEGGRFQKRTYHPDSQDATTCSQGFFDAKVGILHLYVRGGNGGWQIDVQPYAIDNSTLSFEHVYYRLNSMTQEGDQVTASGEWETYQESYRIESAANLVNPCEIPGEELTAEALCCPELLDGLAIPSNTADWELWSTTDGTLSLDASGSSSFEWSKRDSNGTILVDYKGGEFQISATGTWFEDSDGIWVSDETSARLYKGLTPTLIYEATTASLLFEKQ